MKGESNAPPFWERLVPGGTPNHLRRMISRDLLREQTQMTKTTKRDLWAAKGESDGRHAARVLWAEQETIAASLDAALGKWRAWLDDPAQWGAAEAINAGVATLIGCPLEHQDAYYGAYALGNRIEARAILLEMAEGDAHADDADDEKDDQ